MSIRKRVLCEHHFRQQDIFQSGRLKYGAVPIKYSPPTEESSVPSTSQTSPLRVLRAAESPRRYSGMSALEHTSPTVSTSSAIFSVEKASPSVREWIKSASPIRKYEVPARRALFLSPVKEKLTEKLKNQRKAVASKRAKISRLKCQLFKLSSVGGFKFKTKEAATLFKMQSHRTRTPWSVEEKRVAATLYLRSPSAYRYLCKLMILPAESTIRAWLSAKKCFRTGFNKSLMDKIKTKAESMTPMEKACVLLFDEMSIKQCLEYSSQYDLIEGYEDLGNLGRHKKIATEATVFMVRGLYYQWKLPVGYFVSHKGLLGIKSKLLLEECIKHLTNVGLSVKAVICDQSTTNVKAYKALGVSSENPYFHTSCGQKIVALFDPPHLLKSLRNNLLTHDFEYAGKTFSFADIRMLFTIDSNSNSTRAAPQLTSTHIWPTSFQKLSVPLAVQIFSHTTSAALKTVTETGQLKSPTALDTSDFLSQINSLFDAMNSRTYQTKNPDACAMSPSNSHVQQIFTRALVLFTNLKKIDAKVQRPPCFDGFVLTIRAYNELLSSEGCKYLLTSRLNQDPLENFFSSVRQRGGWNRNPSVRVLRGTMRILTIQQILEPPKSTSYNPDSDILLDIGERWEEEINNRNTAQAEFEESSISSDQTEIDEPERKHTSEDIGVVTLEECSKVYFAGYLAHNYHKKYKCKDCLKRMCDIESNLSSTREILILNRTFSNIDINESSGLLAPSSSLLYVVDNAIKVYKLLFNKVAHKLHVVETLVKKTERVVSSDSITCLKCNEQSKYIVEHLFKVLIRKQCKWTSSNMKKTAEAKLKVLQHV